MDVIALRRGAKVGVINAKRVLNRRENAVAAQTPTLDISLLEVERGLGKPIFVGHIMHCVDNVEHVRQCGVLVDLLRRRMGRILSVVEN